MEKSQCNSARKCLPNTSRQNLGRAEGSKSKTTWKREVMDSRSPLKNRTQISLILKKFNLMEPLALCRVSQAGSYEKRIVSCSEKSSRGLKKKKICHSLGLLFFCIYKKTPELQILHFCILARAGVKLTNLRVTWRVCAHPKMENPA